MIKTLLLVALYSLASADENSPAQQKRFDQARQNFLSGYYHHAYEEFKELARLQDFCLPATVAMADCQLALGDYQAALVTLQNIADQGNASTDWHRALAGILRQQGNYSQALKHSQEAISRQADHFRARYELGATYELLGQYDQAIKTYDWFDDLLRVKLTFPSDPVDIHYAGLGFYRYSVLTRHPKLTERTRYVLQELWQKACMVIDLTYWPARLAIADLLQEKYRYEEAMGDYKAVLQQNPHCLPAHLGLGKIAAESWDFENVESRVTVCLDLNPRCTEAYVLLAHLRMLERRFEDAITAANQALQINPNHIEALSYLAAGQIRAGYHDQATQTQNRIYKINSAPAVMHHIIGRQLSDGRQFPEAAPHLLKSIEYDPTNPAPRNELGMMHMQWGKEEQARKVLDAAYKLDAFNARTVNTLRLLEQLEAFEHFPSDNFDIHYNPDSDPVIGEYFSEYLESVYADLCDDFEIELPQKTIIEVFPDQRAFGVRIHGKPWIHTVGACTGWVIAMSAPHRRASGNYNFASVLKHEFTHTVTLAATKNRITHWFTEGLAVYQEDRAKSWTWRKMLANAIRRDELFSLKDIDWGFIRPQKANDRQIAYAQSEWMCEFIVESFGYDSLNQMIRSFRDGQVQRDIIPQITGLSIGEFDDQFKAWARAQAEDWNLPLEPPPDPQAVKWLQHSFPHSPLLHAWRAEHLLESAHQDPGEDGGKERLEQALEHARKALELEEHHRHALLAAARISMQLAGYQASRDLFEAFNKEATEYFKLLAKHHPDQPEPHEYLSYHYREKRDYFNAREHARKLKALQPLNPASYEVLAGVFLEEHNDDLALPELLEYARHQEHDVYSPRQIAQIYKKKGRLREAAWWYKQAIYIDPYHIKTHRNYGKLLSDLGDHEQAIREYRMLTRLEPEKPQHINDLAFAYFRAGQIDRAKEAAQKALELDSNSPAGQLLND